MIIRMVTMMVCDVNDGLVLAKVLLVLMVMTWWCDAAVVVFMMGVV